MDCGKCYRWAHHCRNPLILIDIERGTFSWAGYRIDLTGPWAGFSFLGDRLITPEGRELLPEDLAWLSLTACQAQEWRRMMEAARSAQSIDSSKRGGNLPAVTWDRPATVVNLRDVVSRRKQRSAVAMAGPDAEPPSAVLPIPGPRPRQRV